MSITRNDTKTFVNEVTKRLVREGAGELLTKKIGALFHKMSMAASGRQNAIVESAVSLTSEEQRKLSSLLAKVSGGQVSVTYREKTDLLSGLKIRMGDILIDTSSKKLLSEMTWMLS